MKKPVNEGQEQVAAVLDELKFDLQLFAEDESDTGDENLDTGGDDLGVDENVNDEVVKDEGPDDEFDDSGAVDQDEEIPPAVKEQSPEADRAFAEMRKQKQQAEQQARQMREQVKAEIQAERDADYARRYGQSHGIYTEAEYLAALDRQREQAEAQRKREIEQMPQQVYNDLIERGFEPEIAQGRADQVRDRLELQHIKQELAESKNAEKQRKSEAQKEQRAREILADHDKLTKEFGEIIPSLEALDEMTLSKMQKGYSLYDAWTTSNQTAVLDYARKSAASKTLKNVNSKKHLKSEKAGAGDFGTEANLSPEQLRVWRAMGYSEKEARKRARKYVKQGK